jgi:hypothetical protein
MADSVMGAIVRGIRITGRDTLRLREVPPEARAMRTKIPISGTKNTTVLPPESR